MTLIKICGLTSLEDARKACAAGADWLGFINIRRSKRYLPLASIREIIEKLPHQCKTVVLFDMNETFELPRGPWDAVQLYGLASSKNLPLTEKKVFVAVSKETASEFSSETTVFDESEGTAQTVSGELPDLSTAFLAGGLSSENVADMIRKYSPMGVDVSSGVESRPGKKDEMKLQAFIENARSAFASTMEIKK
jgi:phosphoribosylanthranilate isomerase